MPLVLFIIFTCRQGKGREEWAETRVRGFLASQRSFLSAQKSVGERLKQILQDTFLCVAQAGLSQDISPAESYFHHWGTAREQAQCSGCELGTSPLLRQVVGGRERKMLWRWLVTEVPTHCGGIGPSTAPKPGSCELCSSKAAPSVWREEGVSLDSCLWDSCSSVCKV